jgi:biotin operon repressor
MAKNKSKLARYSSEKHTLPSMAWKVLLELSNQPYYISHAEIGRKFGCSRVYVYRVWEHANAVTDDGGFQLVRRNGKATPYMEQKRLLAEHMDAWRAEQEKHKTYYCADCPYDPRNRYRLALIP